MDKDDLRDIEIRAMKQEEAERARLKNKKTVPTDTDICKFPAVTPEEMMRLRMANVSEEKVADYFGKTIEELREMLDHDEILKLIYDAGPGRGKAKVQVTQYTTALEGDTTMLKHFGEHNLGQKSTVKHEISDYLKEADRIIALLQSQLGQEEVQKMIVDGEFKEIENNEI